MKYSNLVFLLIFWIELVLCNDFLSKFHQHDWKIKDLRIEQGSYDRNYTNYFSIRTFKYNRTTVAINVTVNHKRDMRNKGSVIVQAYKYLSNEYRIFPALRFQVDACKGYYANLAGLLNSVEQCGNMTGCSDSKPNVTYHSCNILVDVTQLPPLVPSGMFKAAIEVLYETIPIEHFDVFFEIYRPFPYPKH